MSTIAAGTIVTLGGGGFSMSEDGSSRIDDLLLEMTGKEQPRVCFVPTASGDAEGYVQRFTAAFSGRARTSVLSLFRPDTWGEDGIEGMLDADLLYVGGGSTVNLLALWRRHGMVDLLHRACARGVILAGISAGMNCWFEACSTDSHGSLAPLEDGLGFLPGGACPHYHGEAGRQEMLRAWVGSEALPPSWAVDDGAALIWRDGRLIEVVAEREGAGAWRVVPDGQGGAREESLTVRRLML